jgi:hypothetical protein
MRYILSSVLLIWGLTLPAKVVPGPAIASTANAARDEPRIDVLGASPTEEARLMLAISRFDRAGLALPDLVVGFFHGDTERCHGHAGLFEHRPEPWRISICEGDAEWVYEHELAHAWERANLADDVRQRFMELRGHRAWADSDVAWNERGVEGVAFVIQQGLSGLPLPPALSDEHRSRLEAYLLLTGQPDPRIGGLAVSAGWRDHRPSVIPVASLVEADVAGMRHAPRPCILPLLGSALAAPVFHIVVPGLRCSSFGLPASKAVPRPDPAADAVDAVDAVSPR